MQPAWIALVVSRRVEDKRAGDMRAEDRRVEDRRVEDSPVYMDSVGDIHIVAGRGQGSQQLVSAESGSDLRLGPNKVHTHLH